MNLFFVRIRFAGFVVDEKVYYAVVLIGHSAGLAHHPSVCLSHVGSQVKNKKNE